MTSKAPKAAFYTLGCKLNFSETSTIARNLTENGYQKVDFASAADVYVINTCSVTENADKECKTIVKKALQTNPNAFVVIVGCYAQLKPNEIAQINGVDLVLGATEKFNIAAYLNQLNKNQNAQVHSCEIHQANTYVSAYSIGDRTRAFLKVQDGCDYKCTYCTIPLARGVSRSDTLDNVLQNAKEITQKEIKEIVLTGVNIGDYGKGELGNKQHEHTFLNLIQALDSRVEGLKRVRISSIEPNLLSNETIDFVAQSNFFVPHFHIPLQSGSDKILKKMKRRYLSELYRERVQYIKSSMPNCCIGVDVIVGFPDETEQDFLTTYDFLNQLDISYLHVFTYSERENTQAANMPNAVPIHERKKRSKMLRILSEKKRMAFYQSQLGRTETVLWEAKNKQGKLQGFTSNYVKVQANLPESYINQLTTVDLVMINHHGIVEASPVLEPLGV